MFQFGGFASDKLFIHSPVTDFSSVGFPHSEIHGLAPIYGSPWLIAVSHVLLRLLMPRHSPYALFSLTFNRSPLRIMCNFLFPGTRHAMKMLVTRFLVIVNH